MKYAAILIAVLFCASAFAQNQKNASATARIQVSVDIKADSAQYNMPMQKLDTLRRPMPVLKPDSSDVVPK